MVVFDPVKVVITNYPVGETEIFRIEETIDETFKWYEAFLRSPQAAVQHTLDHVGEIGEALWRAS